MIDAGDIITVNQAKADLSEATAARVRKLRRDHGLSQAELADMIGCGNQLISKLETCSHTASVWAFVAIARLFGVTVDYLLGMDPGKGGRR